MEYILIQLFYGFSYGSLLFLIASGFSLIFGLMKITNIVHVAYFALGLYLGNYFYILTGSFFGTSVIVMIIVGAFGLFVFRSMLYKMQTFPLGQVLLGLGLLFLVDDGLLWVFGGAPMKTPTPEWLSGNFRFLSSNVSVYRLFMIIVGGIVMIGIDLIVNRTHIGALVRSGVDDEETVRAMGIDIYKVFTLVYTTGAMLAALGGVLGGPFFAMEPRMGFSMLPLVLAIVIVGGLGNLRGAYYASLIIATIDTFAKALFPQLAYFSVYLPVAIICVVKPAGLFVISEEVRTRRILRAQTRAAKREAEKG